MTWSDLLNKLNWTIGLDPDTLGAGTIQAHVRLRMAGVGCQSPEDYLEHLQRHPAELGRLIDEIVVGETWFFRDDRPFVYLVEHIRSLLAQQPGREFRLLSAPCATGEEPYSMVMALLDAGISPQQLVVDAADISGRFLKHAQRGWYAHHAFRGRSADWQTRYFSSVDDGYQIDPQVGRCIRWHQANLNNPAFWQQRRNYDVVFCRNLLIYLDAASRRRLVGWIYQALGKHGLLFAGHAESMDSVDPQFVPVRHPGSFAYAKRQTPCTQPANSVSPPAIADHAASTSPKPPAAGVHRPGMAVALPTRPAGLPSDSIPGTTEQDPLAAAARLADQGQLQKAIIACESHMTANGPAARAYAIIGIAYMAMDDFTAAESALTRALYLDPHHLDSLTHLAILCDRTGRADRAAVLRQRADRITQEAH